MSVISVVLYYERFCWAPTSAYDEIFLQFFATLIFDSFSTKVSLRFHRCCFSFSWRFFWKKLSRGTLIRDLRVQCSKNYFDFVLPQEVGAFGNNIKKKPQKPRPNFKKYVYYIFTENICSTSNSVQVVVFSKNVLIS